VWERPGLDHTQRRLLTIGVLTAVGNHGELDMHIRAALRAGVSADTIGEVMLHTALYAGVPNSNHGFALLDAAVAESAKSAKSAESAETQKEGKN
jgi:4-carboxymuconolactone decarboxylase